jgi:exosortase/archaeosortase family protein
MSKELIINQPIGTPIRKGIYQTAGIFIAGTGILWALINIPWAITYLIDPLALSLAWIVTVLLQILGEPVYQIGIIISSPAVNLEITPACTGIFQIVVLIAGILAWSTTGRERSYAIAYCTLLLMSINIFRIISIYYSALIIPQWVPFIHGVFWEGVMVLSVPLFWIYWFGRNRGLQSRETGPPLRSGLIKKAFLTVGSPAQAKKNQNLI